MPEPAKLKVAIIGRTGKGNYGHNLDLAWLNHPKATIVAVADENAEGRAAAAKRLGITATYEDYTKMIAAERPNIVTVADRFLDLHRDMVVAAAQSGASIFLEKPIARNLAEADEMVAACEKHHVKCAIAHQTRYSPRIKQIVSLIREGVIGELLEMNSHGKCDQRGGGEDMMVLGTHAMDLMRLFAGEPRWCQARITVDGKPAGPGDVKQLGEAIGQGVGDHIVATYGFDGPVIGRFLSFRAATRKTPEAGSKWWMEIRGTRGVIHTAFGGLPAAYLCKDPTWMPGKSAAKWQPITSLGVDQEEPLKAAEVGIGNRPVVDDLVEAIEKDRQPFGSIYDGRAALEMIHAVYEAHRTNRTVDFPLKNRKHPLAGW